MAHEEMPKVLNQSEAYSEKRQRELAEVWGTLEPRVGRKSDVQGVIDMEDSLETALKKMAKNFVQKEAYSEKRQQELAKVWATLEASVQKENEGDNEVAERLQLEIVEEVEVQREVEVPERLQVQGEIEEVEVQGDGNIADERSKLLAKIDTLKGARDNAVTKSRNTRLSLRETEEKLKLQTLVTGVDVLPYKYLVYASICIALAILLVALSGSDFDIKDGTIPIIDACYFVSVTMLSVGFGDIVPRRGRAIFLCDMLSVFGGGFIQFVLKHFVDVFAKWLYQRYLSKVQTRSRRFLCLVLSAAGMIILVIVTGILGGYICERERLQKAFPAHSSAQIILRIFHMTIMTMTTVGYGDVAFATVYGRAFAAFWIPFGTTFFAVAMSVMIAAALDVFLHRWRPHPSREDTLIDMEAGHALRGRMQCHS